MITYTETGKLDLELRDSVLFPCTIREIRHTHNGLRLELYDENTGRTFTQPMNYRTFDDFVVAQAVSRRELVGRKVLGVVTRIADHSDGQVLWGVVSQPTEVTRL